MRFLSICFLLLFSNTAFGQVEKIQDKYMASRFKDLHNINKTDSIYYLFSADMQAMLPMDKARKFLSELKQQAGPIRRMDFIGYDGPYAIYRTTFEKGTFLVNIALNEQHKINGFFVKPDEEEQAMR